MFIRMTEYKEGYIKGREEAITEYKRNANNRIIFELCDLMPVLNKSEILSAENPDMWLKNWKTQVVEKIEQALCDIEEEMKGANYGG